MGRYAAVLLLCLAPLFADAQDARRVYRIGVLNEAWSADHPTVEGLKAGLKDLGLEEGRDVRFEIRFTQGKPEALSTAATALVTSDVDLIVAVGQAAALAASRATHRIPIVFTSVGDAVAAGILADRTRPGGNVTGISSLQSELAAKRLQVLHSLAPAVRRVFVVHERSDPVGASIVRNAVDAAPALGLDVVVRDVDDDRDLVEILAQIGPGDALFAADDSRLRIPVAVLERSLASRTPAIFGTALWVGHGGLISYGPDAYAEGVQAASLAARILGGTKPGDLPVEGAERIDLAVNLKTAERLGLVVPRRILLRADAFRR
ncbi:MAG TPA: ABC transporter substrate-binding protein [Casimicrobiaceae bacterium]|jgi:putative ABC transport system substrate-binding protein|nr:ABC transporter substrate-binding protein [Casimicrobiaceae bacterium]